MVSQTLPNQVPLLQNWVATPQIQDRMTDNHLHLRLHRRLKIRTSALDTTGDPVEH
ncbi:hypothetical protein N7460_008068 [Penicillium canescens]|uniref:Uncharacterized protein n=1 Tax=Penicillium canescens TaxID=5083 RepID=A0AAD6N879_PENCN|nr:hypothetical protein N7460_008068 [Penicillium canescens]